MIDEPHFGTGPRHSVRVPVLQHDPDDPVESAVLDRLANNWHRRATVKRQEPDLDDLFDPAQPDYPERLLPFRNHPVYRALDNATRAQVLGWGWVAFNKHVMDTEQHIVNPTFALVIDGTFDTGLNTVSMNTSVAQAMVDEQYHTLIHLNALSVMRRHRGWRMSESVLPLGYKARRFRARMAQTGERWERELTALAFTTVGEISVKPLLDLMANDHSIQSINTAVAAIHNRDEYCHSLIAAEIAAAAYSRLDDTQARLFREAMADAMDAFAANDYMTWHNIVDLVGMHRGHEMIDEVQAESTERLFSDFTGLHRFCTELEIIDDIPFDWSTVIVG